MRGVIPPVVVAVVLLAGWQVLHMAAGADTISAPGETLMFLVKLMGTAWFWLDVGETGMAFLWALLLSMAIGIALGVILGLQRTAGDVIEPLLVIFYSLPKVTLYPVVLLMFGLGISAKIAFGVMHGLVPITLLTRNAIRQLKPVYWQTARVLQLSHAEAVRLVVLPAIVPELVAGIRIGLSLSLLGVLIGEMFASKRGLGFAAMNAMGLGDIKTILAIGVFLAAFAIAANVGLLFLEHAVRHRSVGPG
jgi:NitT/TauT family transport system permease protein